MKKYSRLLDKIKFVKKVLGTPYHFFYAGVKSTLICIRFEDKYGKHFNFTGSSMFDAVTLAEKYVQDEIAKGYLKDPTKKKEDKIDDIINVDENK